MKEKSETGLEPHQEEIVAAFMKREVDPKAQEKFDRGFENALKLDEIRSEIEDTVFKPTERLHRKITRRLENKITPAPRRVAITRNSKITALALQYFRKHGPPQNIGQFIDWLRKRGALSRVNRFSGDGDLTERAVRALLKKKFDV